MCQQTGWQTCEWRPTVQRSGVKWVVNEISGKSLLINNLKHTIRLPTWVFITYLYRHLHIFNKFICFALIEICRLQLTSDLIIDLPFTKTFWPFLTLNRLVTWRRYLIVAFFVLVVRGMGWFRFCRLCR